MIVTVLMFEIGVGRDDSYCVDVRDRKWER